MNANLKVVHFLWKKFILNINLDLILHNISCGVKRIPPNVQRNISNIGIQFTIQLNVSLVFMVFMFFTCSKKFMFSTTYAFLSYYHNCIMHIRMNCCIVFWDVPQFYKKDYLFFDSIPIQREWVKFRGYVNHSTPHTATIIFYFNAHHIITMTGTLQ